MAESHVGERVVSKRPKVVHLTSVHPPDDNRIRHKECATLATAGWEVVLIACARRSETGADGVRLRALPPPPGRVSRMTVTAWRMYRAALDESADLYVFHDPELMPWALMLKAHGKRVVYDIHEDVPGTVAYKTYLPRPIRPAIADGLQFVQRACARWFDALVVATPHLGALVRDIGPPVVIVQNFPRLEELPDAGGQLPYAERREALAYVGVVSRGRGVREMIEAVADLEDFPGAVLHIAGRWMPGALRDQMSRHRGWPKVVNHGQIERRGVVELLSECRVGLVTIWPEQNYLMSYPTKMFEYMAMGLPVVASDFPLWRRIVEESGAGILVDPTRPESIRDAISWLLTHASEAEAMGERGRMAVRSRFYWGPEGEKLVQLCSDIIQS